MMKNQFSELERQEEKKRNNQSQSKDYIDLNKLTENNEQMWTPQATSNIVQNGKGLQSKDENGTAINSGKKNHSFCPQRWYVCVRAYMCVSVPPPRL